MSILKLTDFKGEYNIPDAKGWYSTTNLQSYLDRYELRHLNQLLGVELGKTVYDRMIAASPPANADLDKIINAFSYQKAASYPVLESAGIKEYLTAVIFYEYTHVSAKNAQAGVVDVAAENAIKYSIAGTCRIAENKFNGILDTVEAIQQYCLLNPDKYVTYAGQQIKVKASNIL